MMAVAFYQFASMNIAILDDYHDTLRHLPSFAKLKPFNVTVFNDAVSDVNTLAARLMHTDALVLIRERTSITANLLKLCPRLKLISQRGVYPHVDTVACTEQGVMLCSNMSADTPSYAAAELTLGLALAAARKIPQQMASLKNGTWQIGVGQTLRGQVMGVFGYGRIGTVVAGYAKALGMRVLVHARDGNLMRAKQDGHEVCEDREQFFSQVDVLTLHMRLLDATRGIVTAKLLACMKPSAILVNTSRSGLIEKGALEAAVQSNRLACVAVDVFNTEPVSSPVPSWLQHPRVIATPHIGYVTEQEYEFQFSDVFDQIVTYAQRKPIHVINPSVLDHPRQRADVDAQG